MSGIDDIFDAFFRPKAERTEAGAFVGYRGLVQPKDEMQIEDLNERVRNRIRVYEYALDRLARRSTSSRGAR